VDFVLQADTQLSGRLLDAKDAPVAGVWVDLEPLENRGDNGARFFDCSNADGVFKMAMMPSGKYWLVARDEVILNRLKSSSTLYYPGVRDRSQATVISIEAGKYIDHLDIRLPSDETRYQIVGRFELADGAPVAGRDYNVQVPAARVLRYHANRSRWVVRHVCSGGNGGPVDGTAWRAAMDSGAVPRLSGRAAHEWDLRLHGRDPNHPLGHFGYRKPQTRPNLSILQVLA
jgi:hypothetical protein